MGGRERPARAGRRSGRIAADGAWLALGARVFRLAGHIRPGRSALDRVASGRRHRIALPGQVFSRIHVDDIVGGIRASLAEGRAGPYNLADDSPAPQNAVVETACALLNRPLPPHCCPLEAANLSPAARAFYAERRRIANGRAKRLPELDPALAGLARRPRRYCRFAASAMTSPASTSTPPAAAPPTSDSPRTASRAPSRSPGSARWYRPPAPARSPGSRRK